MPRGYRNYYIKFVAITRHVLQVGATNEKDCLEKAMQFAREGDCDGLQVSDSSRPLLIHPPFNPWFGEFSFNEDGPFIYAGNVFAEQEGSPDHPDPKAWMRELGQRLIADADAARLPDPNQKLPCPSRLFDVRISILQKKEIYRCRDCGRVSRTTRKHSKPWKNTASHDKTMASAWDMAHPSSSTSPCAGE